MISAENLSPRDRILGGLWGSLVGDALGVPVEFRNRSDVQMEPVQDLRAFGTHSQPAGTWSDDSSMILCTAESLLNHEFALEDMGQRFVRWLKADHWTAHGDVFDIGGTTLDALLRITKGMPAAQAGGQAEDNNGNGSLMRILPVALRFASEPTESFVRRLESTSAITHGHARSRLACAFYGLMVRRLLWGGHSDAALAAARAEFAGHYERVPEFSEFHHILADDLTTLPEGEIVSTGYVLHTLHASLWCLLTTSNYRDCVLKAVNLGGDTDTTGCVAGGLAGVAHGLPAVPAPWIHQLARQAEVAHLFDQFANIC